MGAGRDGPAGRFIGGCRSTPVRPVPSKTWTFGTGRCRWLVLDPVWIGLTEQVLISDYQPLWNVVVEGIGINAPGRGRGNQARSQWDTLHPGRPEVADLPDREESAETILEAISAHRRVRERRGGMVGGQTPMS